MKKMTYTGTKKRDNKKTNCRNYVVNILTTSCFYFTNTQLTKPAHVSGPFVIVMERLPTALPKQSGTKSIITTHHPNASSEAAVNHKRKK